MKKIFLFAAATAVVLSSCSKNEVTTSSLDNQAIGFGLYTGVSTKGLELTNGASVDDKNTGIQATGFGVFGYFQDDDVYTSGTSTANFMFNTQVSYASSAWSYSPVKYWSNDVNDRYSFFAYAPSTGYTNGGVTANSSFTNTTASAPSVTFTIDETAADMIDFVAGQTMDVYRDGQATTQPTTMTVTDVDINLKHQLSRVKFTGITDITTTANGEANTVVVVKAMSLLGSTSTAGKTSAEFYKSGVYTFATTSTNAVATTNKALDATGNGTWAVTDSDKQTADYSFTDLVMATTGVTGIDSKSTKLTINKIATDYIPAKGAIITNDATAYDIFTDNQYLFLIPPTSTGLSAADKMFVKIEYDIVTADNALNGKFTGSSNEVIISLPASTLAQGKAYDFKLTFSLDKVVLTPNVVAWDTEVTNSTITTGSSTNGTPVNSSDTFAPEVTPAS